MCSSDLFHKAVCSQCHRIPHSKEWLEEKPKEGMEVTYVAKRIKPFQHWEPIYIGTNEEPLYDERLSWEGRSDKMVQGYKLCALDYEFHILNNAFLIHRPGIKTKKTLHSAIDNKKIAAQATKALSESAHADISKLRSKQARDVLEFKKDLTDSTEKLYKKMGDDELAQNLAMGSLNADLSKSKASTAQALKSARDVFVSRHRSLLPAAPDRKSVV